MKTIYVVIGPTASGKSDRAVELALQINGEVINADSRQVYIGLDVGTGKITKDEMKGVRHHLLSYVEVPQAPLLSLELCPTQCPVLKGEEQYYSVSRWVRDASAVIDDIVSRGKVPIICGGTGMYIYSLIYGLDHDIAPDIELRKELNQIDTAELFNKYKEINGEPADNSISNNRPRLIRAIEIFEKSKDKNNKSGEDYKSKKENRRPLYNVKYIRMERGKEELLERISRRTDIRLEAMIAETTSLLDAGIDREWLSTIGIEYREILKYLNKEIDIAQLRSNIILRSLQYAKRQNTWNKKYFQD